MDKAQKFRKKPVVIEAVKWDGDAHTANVFIGESFGLNPDYPGEWDWTYDWDGEGLIIPTLEGKHRANLGDWIIKGIKGEFYPCKPDIFEATYEPVP